jgi:quinoprotein glucose dehydrogenase
MTRRTARFASTDWIFVGLAVVALVIALTNYFWQGNGIHGTPGALLVVISTALLVVGTCVVARYPAMHHGWRIALLALILVDAVGTCVAAYFLEAWLLLGVTVLAVIDGFLVLRRGEDLPVGTVRAMVIAAMAAVVPVSVFILAGSPNARADTQPSAAASEAAKSSNAASPAAAATNGDWYTFNGDLMDQKYANLDQITPQNVSRLRKVWEVHTGDVSDGSGKVPVTDWSATPLFVNGAVYVGTPFYRIFSIQPDTGHVNWIYDTHAPLKALTQPDLKSRGVAYWQAVTPEPGKACQKIVYIGTMDAKLHAVDADKGVRCEGFGDHGVLDIDQWNEVNPKFPLSILQPPTVYKDTLFIGWAGKDWAFSAAPPGDVFAVDAQTGRLKWTFHALPSESAQHTGTANVWASMSVDPAHDILYLPVSSPSPNFYGGDRKQDLPLATSVTALDTNTGKVLWSRQIVHHDIWDYDTNAPPTLVDLHIAGKTVPALVQTSKMGFLFVLNRLTGEPVYPIEEKPVPQTDVAGEQSAPTQPYPVKPEATVPDRMPGVSTLADWTSFGQCSRELHDLRYDGRYTPPSLKGSIAYPSTAGGVEWGGGAVDPARGVYVVNSSAVAQIYRLVPRDEYERKTKNGTPQGYYDQAGAPYGFYLENWVNIWGMPCWAPPYGTLSAYDLNTGGLLWRKPFGEVQKWGFYMPDSWGSVTIGGPLVTKSGLVFAGGSMDARVRAIDLKSGEVLWKSLVDAPAVANPSTFLYKGRQYVVFVAGGNAILKPDVADQVVAFALPDDAR